MPKPMPRGFRLGVVEPKEALRRFESRQLLLPTFRWQDAWGQDHARGFAVAGVAKTDVLQLLYDELAPAVAEGRRVPEFAKAVQAKLVAKGFWGDVEVKDPTTGKTRTTRFDASRLALIHGVNTRQSFAAGRWERIERGKARLPYVMYRTMRDERVRTAHAAWDGLALPVGHPFWETHFPPCGWRCRCTAFAIDEKGLERYRKAGFKVQTEAPQIEWVTYVNPHTGETALVPRGIDPGFGTNPGKEPMAGVLPRALRDTGFKVASYVPAPDTAPMPEPRPRPASLLMEPGQDAGAYVDAFIGAFGTRRDAAGQWLPRVFTDAAGEEIVIGPGMFAARAGAETKVFKRNRERFVQLLAEAIKEPDEIWLLPMFTQAGKSVAIRRRYVARFQLEGQAQPLLAVFEWGKDGWTGITGYQTDDAAYLNNQRRGYLAYRRRP